MKPRLSKRPEAGLTAFEVGVVVAVVIIVAMFFLPALAKAKRKSSRVYCTNNLKQIGLAYRIWSGDNHDIFPMGVSVTDGGSMELVRTGDVVVSFQVMSNELSTVKILICNGDPDNPGDASRSYATDFKQLSNSNISYCVGVDTTSDTNSRMILSGDCNFRAGSKSVNPGLLSVWAGDPIAWQPPRHGKYGNLGFADGSVQHSTDSSLCQYLKDTGVATNHLAIP